MSSGRKQYPFNLIEPKWQQFWEEQQSFRAFNPGEEIPAEHPFAKRYGLSGKVAERKLPPKFYVLDMFPYPSGAGLHVGHPEGYTATDILARYKRAAGLHVLHPMGWDAFGLPAEQYAIKTGQHPRKTTEANITTFKRQIKSLGFSYDWTREADTTDPNYFKWTQWIFLKLYNSYFDHELNKAQPISLLEDALSENPQRESEWKDNAYLTGTRAGLFEKTNAEERDSLRREFIPRQRLAYVSDAPVWWCPGLGTVLANEEVIDGKSEVGGFAAFQKPMRQWLLRITAYAERLLSDLESIDWSISLKEMQRNWIGRSEGAEVVFKVEGTNHEIKVFTTRPDTLFGATFMVLAPEHPLVALQPEGIVPFEWPKDDGVLDLTLSASPSSATFQNRGSFKSDIPWHAVRMCREWASEKSELNRRINKEKLGVPTGAFAINPVNGQRIPIWIGDYVLLRYAKGAIMAVPAHDQRDLEFALEFGGLKIPPVVSPPKSWLKQHFNPPLEFTQWAKQVEKALGCSETVVWSDGVLQQAVIDLVNRTRLGFSDLVRLLEQCRESRCDTSAQTEASLADSYRQFPQFFSDGKLPVAFADEGISFNSNSAKISLDGLFTTEAKKKIIAWLKTEAAGEGKINYKLSDWLFSRQRYWGEPFPIVWKKDANGNAYHEALPESALPLLPPALDDYKPTPDGQPPLARAKDWVNLPDGSQRETNTMPQWAGSCWYYLRYLDARNEAAFVSSEAEKYWMGPVGRAVPSAPRLAETASPTPGVDLYVGGTEHAVLHLLYARFWHKVLFDLGYVSTPEPFFKLVNQGLILGEDGQKMSKSRGNVINPDDILVEYGADAFRLYEMFMGPLEMVKPWNTKGVEGVYRFLGRVWRLFVDEQSEVEFEQAQTTTEAQRHRELLYLIKVGPEVKDVEPTREQLKVLHTAIKKVTEDLDGLRFNTAISAMMVFVNEATAWETRPVSVLRYFLILLQPFAPHIAEELWEKLSEVQSPRSKVADGGAATLDLAYQPWPKFDPALLVEDILEIPVQVNGKLRDVIRVPAAATQQEIEASALKTEKAQPFINGKTVKKVIVVPKKLVNIVVA